MYLTNAWLWVVGYKRWWWKHLKPTRCIPSLADTHVFLINNTTLFVKKKPLLHAIQKHDNLDHCYYITTTFVVMIFDLSITLTPTPTPMLPSSSILAWPTFVIPKQMQRQSNIKNTKMHNILQCLLSNCNFHWCEMIKSPNLFKKQVDLYLTHHSSRHNSFPSCNSHKHTPFKNIKHYKLKKMKK